MAEIVSMTGAPVEMPGEPNPKIAQLLQDLLSQAEAGRIRGLAFAIHRSDDTIATGWSHSGHDFFLCSAITTLFHRYATRD